MRLDERDVVDENSEMRHGARWTAPPNKELKQTKPSRNGASQLNSVLCGLAA
jgi:hypothetical protein